MLAAMLAMVLVAAAPALGQATAIDDTQDTSYEDSFNTICPQVVAAFGAQTNYGDANAAAADESEAAAVVAQEFGLSVEQVNACLGGLAAGGDVNVDDDDDGDDGDTVVVVDGTASASASGSASSSASASASSSASASAATAVLPETGGSSLLALGAGALLVAGGLLARRIVR